MIVDRALEILTSSRAGWAEATESEQLQALRIGVAAIRSIEARAHAAVAFIELEFDRSASIKNQANVEAADAAEIEEDAAMEEYGKALRGET